MTDLETLARLVRQRREELGLSQKTAAASVGMSAMTWNRVEVQAEPVKPLSYSGVERALGWAPGSIREYLNGGPEPAEAEPDELESTEIEQIARAAAYNVVERWRDQARRTEGPGIYVASDAELLDELGRRLGQRRGHGVQPDEEPGATETAQSVTARGMVPGRELIEQPEGPNRAEGGQA